MKYIGPTYYGHPYLDGRTIFLDGHPLDGRNRQLLRSVHLPANPYPTRYPREAPAMKIDVKIGTFGADDSADIAVNGKSVGWLERVRGERFASASSRKRVPFVSHYSIVLTDTVADAQLRKSDVASRAEAKLEVARACELAGKARA